MHNLHSVVSSSPRVVYGPATVASPGNLSEIQIIGPHPKPIVSEASGLGPSTLRFNKPSWWFQFEKLEWALFVPHQHPSMETAYSFLAAVSSQRLMKSRFSGALSSPAHMLASLPFSWEHVFHKRFSQGSPSQAVLLRNNHQKLHEELKDLRRYLRVSQGWGA